jgi:hypothetical protein
MSRLVALPLAFAITFVLLAGTTAGVAWVMSHIPSFAQAAARHRSATGIATMISLYAAVWLPLLLSGIFAKMTKTEEPMRLTPLIRRSPATGQREL